jgi:hypothetical protein
MNRTRNAYPHLERILWRQRRLLVIDLTWFLLAAGLLGLAL